MLLKLCDGVSFSVTYSYDWIRKKIYEHGTDTGANSRKQQECCSV